jgi:hypothetical protein
MNKQKNKKLEVVKHMPPKFHKLPGQEYETKKSEVIKWLIMNPSILEFIWDHVKQSGDVIYNSNTGKWQGVDYEDN